MPFPRLTLHFAAALIAAAVGCAHGNIPNTRVEDTEQNREVVEFMEKYRMAVEKRDVASLLGMASRDYFDDMGTPAGDDDVDYEGLEAGLQRMREEVLAARYQISYRAISFIRARKVLVDVLYTGWFKVQTDEGTQWRRRLEPHRLVLAREDNAYRILSGM